MRTYLEVLAWALNAGIWGGPFLAALRRRRVNLLHPSGFLSLYVIFVEGVALTEHWFGWSMRPGGHGLRIQIRQYQDEFWFYLIPLGILALVGVAFHAGVFLATRRLTPGPHDRFYLDSGFRTVGAGGGPLFLWAALLSIPICLLPFILFGEDSGFFWTVPLFYAANFLPLTVSLQDRRLGFALLLLGVPLLGLRGSKGDFIYYLLPWILYYQGHLLRVRGRFRLRRLLLVAAVLPLVIAGTAEVAKQRGEWAEDTDSVTGTVVSKVITREYSFETFALLVHAIPFRGNLGEGSWIWREVTELVPGSLLTEEKTRASQEVARRFLPDEYAVLPDAGFYSFFAFPFYHDFGVVGTVLTGALIGFAIASFYRWALARAWSLRALWPVLLYLPVVVYTQMFVNGALAFFLTHTAFAIALVGALAMAGVSLRAAAQLVPRT